MKKSSFYCFHIVYRLINGNIVICGGTIWATGADHCAGIGSNDGRTTGGITLYGGNVTATGGSNGAGIGGAGKAMPGRFRSMAELSLQPAKTILPVSAAEILITVNTAMLPISTFTAEA